MQLKDKRPHINGKRHRKNLALKGFIGRSIPPPQPSYQPRIINLSAVSLPYPRIIVSNEDRSTSPQLPSSSESTNDSLPLLLPQNVRNLFDSSDDVGSSTMHLAARPFKKRKLNGNSQQIANQNDANDNDEYAHWECNDIHALKLELNRIKAVNKENIARIKQLESLNASHESQYRQISELALNAKSNHSNLTNTINQIRSNNTKQSQMIKSMEEDKKLHIKLIRDQVLKINQKDIKLQNYENLLAEKTAKIQKLKQKYAQIKGVTAKLYLECVNGEEPRWDLITAIKCKHNIIRDEKLSKLRNWIRALNGESGKFNVCGIGKWEKNKKIESLVESFLQTNGEYNANPVLALKDEKRTNIGSVIQKYKICDDHRIAALKGQYGIRALVDIPKNAVLGQYIGAEISYNAFSKIFEGTAVEFDHNIYSLDLVIDDKQFRKILKKHHELCDDDKWFVVDPLIENEACNGLLFPFVNDCRMDIDKKEPTREDNKYFNVEFVGMSVNGWPQTYLIATRDIEKGEELQTFYGEIFGLAIKNKMINERKKKKKKIRIDREIFNELKDELQSTFRLCQHV